MKAPLRWLAQYVDLPDSIEDLVERLTLSGTEIEDVIRTGEHWDDVVIGRVVRLERPPGSNRLYAATLDVGQETLLGVTAAPNIEEGQKVPVVRVGGIVPRGPEGEPFVLQPRTMMGIAGEAMVLSARELNISDEHAGILELSDDAPVGAPLSSIMAETTLDVGVTANRPDEMSMLGIAREIAATTGTELRAPDLAQQNAVGQSPSLSASVEVLDPDLCPRYTALRVEGVRVRPSPEWLVERLESAGMRSINNVVDATNFVMLELGEPLHAFDLRQVSGAQIIVRRCRPDETIVTLDGVERALPADTLVIADPNRPLAIAGIMGGENSEVSEGSTTILLESANFNQVNVRRSARRLGLRTEASARFERGVPPELTEPAANRFVNVLASTMEGQLTVGQVVDVREPFPDLPVIELTPSQISRFLGIEVPIEDAVGALVRLGFVAEPSNEHLRAKPPYWRRDVEGAADLSEEIARLLGYDRIPESLLGQETPPAPPPPDLQWEAVIRNSLWGIGLSESWTDTLTSPESLARLFPDARAGSRSHWERVIVNPLGVKEHGARAEIIQLVNAPSRERSALRLSLVPALLDVVARNLKHSRERIAFFEIARTFFTRPGDLPYERRTLAIGIAGNREPRSWNTSDHEYDFFDLKGMISEVMHHVGIEEGQAGWLAWPPGPDRAYPALHPGRSALLTAGDTELGYLGEIHPDVAQNFEIEAPLRAYAAEIDLDAVMALASTRHTFHGVSRFPAVKREIALAFPENVPSESVLGSVTAAGGDLLRQARIVDVYHGESLGPGRKSIAIALEFQSDTDTLTQEQASAIQNAIVGVLERDLGGELRS